MENWYRIHFTQDQVAQGAGRDITLQFADCQLRANVPAAFALFEEKRRDVIQLLDTSDEVDPTETYFLPPSAARHCAQLLERYAAEPCSKPDPSTVRVSVGKDSDFAFWFS